MALTTKQFPTKQDIEKLDKTGSPDLDRILIEPLLEGLKKWLWDYGYKGIPPPIYI